MSQVLGIDASTQSITAVLVDLAEGKVVAESSINFGAALPGYRAPHGYIQGGTDGEVHADPCMWLDGLDLLLETMQADGVDFSRVEAVSGAGQQHGSVYLNADWFARIGELDPRHDLSDQLRGCLARATSPIWMDTSTTAECAEIAAAVGGQQRVCELSGSHAVERFTGPQIRRFAKTDAPGYVATKRIHLVSSFIASIFAGRDAPIDTGDGAGMNLMNLSALEWDSHLLAATADGLAERMPELLPSNTVIGTISPYFSRYGFSRDARVIAFTGDNNSSLVGMGASQPGTVVISLGTSDTFFAAMPQARTDPNGYGHVFGNPLGGYMTLQCFRNGSLARERIKEQFELSWREFDETVFAETAAGNEGNFMLPFFEAEITPRVDSRKPLLFGSDAFLRGNDRYAMVRACVEGQFLNMALHAGWMGLQPEVLLLTGGAAKSPGISKVVADVFGVPVARLDVTSSVALGAALRAANTGCGTPLADLEKAFCCPVEGTQVQPDARAHEVYKSMMPAFSAAIESIK
jgi:xylulokinase